MEFEMNDARVVAAIIKVIIFLVIIYPAIKWFINKCISLVKYIFKLIRKLIYSELHFSQRETCWEEETKVDDINKEAELWLQKLLIVENVDTKKIIKMCEVTLVLVKKDDFIESFIDKKKEYYLAELSPHIYFRVFLEGCLNDYGTAVIRLYASSGEIFEENLGYLCEMLEIQSVLTFRAEDRMIGARLYKAFVHNRIKKIEILPTEDKTFNRIYFDVDGNDCYALVQMINDFAKKQKFKIVNL